MAESIREQNRRIKAQKAADKTNTEEKKKETKSLSEDERRVAEKSADKKISKEDAKKEVAKDNIKRKTGYSAEAFAEVARTVLETKDAYDHATLGQVTDALTKVQGNNVQVMLEGMAKDPTLAKDVVRAGLGAKFTSTNEGGVQEGAKTVLDKNQQVGGAAGMEQSLTQAVLYGQGMTLSEIKELKIEPEKLKKKVEELRTEAPRIPETDDKHRLNRKEQTDAERSKAARERLLNNR